MFNVKEEDIRLDKELYDFIKENKDKKGNLIMILHKVQEHYGYIPREVAISISKILNIPLAQIYGVATFYHLFKLRKPGKYIIQVCMGTACYLKGGEDMLKELENILGIGVGGTTSDELFSIEAVRCLGCCGLAPVLKIGDDVYGRLTKEQLPEIIAKYRAKMEDNNE